MDLRDEFKHESIDWRKIKEILCGIAESLKGVCDMLPAGVIKNIVCGLAAVLLMICSQIPERLEHDKA